ncbi:hypothetical protein Ocin01_19956, partial [Orchesella cincta]
MNDLSVNGFRWKLECGMSVVSKVYFTNCTADSPARCLLQGNKQFNLKYGCNWCENPGERVEKGKSHCRVYCTDFEHVLRSGEEYRIKASESVFENGIKAASPFLKLNTFNIVDGFTVDIMHCVYLGIVRTLTNLWLEASHSDYYIGKAVSEIDNVLLNCKTPSEICRNFRSIKTNKYWKATEWRSWLFVAPIVLKGILPKQFVKHFQKLASLIYDVTCSAISDSSLVEAESMVLKFSGSLERLYGKSNLTFNVHQLNHLVQSVKNWGPAWGTSAFPFESFN